MKKIILITLLAISFNTSFAHDEGHGPKLTEQPKYGGALAAVIDKKEIEKGYHAKMLYKGELTKTGEGVVRVYLYDQSMKLIDISQFSGATAELAYKDRKTKKYKKKTFELKKQGASLKGKMPVRPRPPFNIDVTVKASDKDLFMAFDGLN